MTFMIQVIFNYFCKKENKWKVGYREFISPEAARRFIILCKKSKDMEFIQYLCPDYEDNEYIWSRI